MLRASGEAMVVNASGIALIGVPFFMSALEAKS